MANGTMTIEETAPPEAIDRIQQLTEDHKTFLQRQQPIQRIKWTWTSDAGGLVAGFDTTYEYVGIVAAVTTDPGAPAPSVDYDIVILATGIGDILGGQGANRHTANIETVKNNAAFAYFGPSTLECSITNAGASKQGVVYIWIKSP